MKKLIVATDFSAIADQTFFYAAQLAVHTQATLVLAHVMAPSPFLAHSPGDLIDETLHDMQAQVRDHLQMLTNRLSTDIRENITCEQVVAEGLVIDQLNRLVTETAADILVMGTHGASGLREVIMGTHAASMVGRCAVPLLLIPPGTTYQPLHHIVYGIDYRDIPEEELTVLRDWVGAFKAKLTLLHIDTEEGVIAEDQLFNLRNTIAAFDEMNEVAYDFVENADPVVALSDYVEEAAADLLVIKHRPQVGLGKWLHKSMARQLTAFTDCPMLII